MKRYKFLLITFLITFNSSCIFFTPNSNKAFDKATKNVRFSNYKAFLVLNSGDTLFGKKWKLKKSTFLELDGKRYIDSSVHSFQSPYGLATRFRSAKSAHSFIDQWAYYLVRGKINFFTNVQFGGYESKYNSDTKTYSKSPIYMRSYYYKFDLNDKFSPLESSDILKKLIQNNPNALQEFEKSNMYKKNDYKWLEKTIRILNIFNKS